MSVKAAVFNRMWAIFLLIGLECGARAADVVLISRTGDDPRVGNQVRLASQFYGSEVLEVAANSRADGARVSSALKNPDLKAVVITTSALGDLNQIETLRALKRADGTHVPLLIICLSPLEKPDALSAWSGHAVESCKLLLNNHPGWELLFSGDRAVVGPLAGIKLSLPLPPACALVLSSNKHVSILSSARSTTELTPIVVSMTVKSQPLVVIAATPAPVPRVQFGTDMQSDFSPIAGIMVFLKQSMGERAWQMPGHFANLTVDDPWLIDPYGSLGYKALLDEMEKHSFHTTIAFVPWNFDRSRQDVVSLFRSHPNRFSICIHGNNHDHQEFGDTSFAPSDREQVQNIKQALARMDRFEKLTSIPYDKVMVFPQGIARVETLALLKKYNYLATVNSQNVPMGSQAPQDPLYWTRPWTVSFEGLPSIKRVSAEVPISQADMSIRAFLGNPQLFYVHQQYFDDNIGAFNDTADKLRALDPDINWHSLGYIVRHLYLMRTRQDQDFDILAYSPSIELSNGTTRRARYYITLTRNDADVPRQLLIDGKPSTFKRVGNDLICEISLEAGQTRTVETLYENDLVLADTVIAKSSTRVFLLRWLSDVRDLYLPRTRVGRTVRGLYYRYEFDRIELAIERMAVAAIIVLCLAFLVARVGIRLRKKAVS